MTNVTNHPRYEQPATRLLVRTRQDQALAIGDLAQVAERLEILGRQFDDEVLVRTADEYWALLAQLTNIDFSTSDDSTVRRLQSIQSKLANTLQSVRDHLQTFPLQSTACAAISNPAAEG